MKYAGKVEVDRSIGRLLALLLFSSAGSAPAMAAEPFKLGAQEKGYVQDSQQGYADYPSYPAPHLMRPQSGTATASPPLQGGAQSEQPAQRRPPLQMGIQKVVLPPQFLGLWNVQGQRTKVEAQAEFQAGAERSFAVNTSNTWEIKGDAQAGYTMGSNTGVRSPMVVDRVQGSQAFIRYQHPIGNTMAQEAIVMSLQPGGAQFNGLERVSIVKQGQPPRSRVTYQLTGYRR